MIAFFFYHFLDLVFFSIPPVTFYFILFLSNFVIILLISIYFIFNFLWLEILHYDFFLFFFYEIISVSSFRLAWFNFDLFLGLFLNWFSFLISSFDIRLLGLELHDFSCFPFFRLIMISYPESRISRINLCWLNFFYLIFFSFSFHHFFYWELSSIVLFYLFCIDLSWFQDQTMDLACWLQPCFFVLF